MAVLALGLQTCCERIIGKPPADHLGISNLGAKVAGWPRGESGLALAGRARGNAAKAGLPKFLNKWRLADRARTQHGRD